MVQFRWAKERWGAWVSLEGHPMVGTRAIPLQGRDPGDVGRWISGPTGALSKSHAGLARLSLDHDEWVDQPRWPKESWSGRRQFEANRSRTPGRMDPGYPFFRGPQERFWGLLTIGIVAGPQERDTARFIVYTLHPPRPAGASATAARHPGEVSERLKEQHWKCCIRVTVSGVRISPSPLLRQTLR